MLSIHNEWVFVGECVPHEFLSISGYIIVGDDDLEPRCVSTLEGAQSPVQACYGVLIILILTKILGGAVNDQERGLRSICMYKRECEPREVVRVVYERLSTS